MDTGSLAGKLSASASSSARWIFSAWARERASSVLGERMGTSYAGCALVRVALRPPAGVGFHLR